MSLPIFLALPLGGTAAIAAPPEAPPPKPAAEDDRPHGETFLSIEDALRRAVQKSQSVQIAESQVTQATGQQFQARSGYFPQVSAGLTYQRTFASEYDDLFSGFGSGPTGTGTPTGTAPPTTVPTPGTGTPDDATSVALPFGQPNTWRFGFTINQNLFGGFRTWALNRMANAGKNSAEIGLESARAGAVLETAQAYFDAVLSDNLLEIASRSLSLAQATLEQTELNQKLGRQPEFDLMRARVVVDNQKVAVINARQVRDTAQQRLRQLLELDPNTELELASPLEAGDVTSVVVDIAGAAPAGSVRAPVRQLGEAATASRASVAVARADALPQLAASANIGWVRFPNELLPFGKEDLGWLASSTAAVSLSVPLFNGGRIWGSYHQARGALNQSEAQLQQTSELADLDAQQAASSLDAAEANWTATEGVVEQAQKAYEIADLRFKEGVSTQLELSDSRIQLEQALVNRARAARDLAVAKIRVALLSSLPLTQSSSF